MNFQNNKTQELLNTLNSLESCYTPTSPNYKFSHVFYNIVDSPFERPSDFPVDLWAKYFIPEAPLMPVILNRIEIEERKELQNELIVKLVESKSGIHKKLESLKVKRELVKNRLNTVVENFKNKTKKYVSCNGNIGKVQTEVLEREKFVISCNKEEVLDYLEKMNEKLLGFEKKVNECMHMTEKKATIARQMNKAL